jgi:transcriptional regulator with XRE-family HTH domain
MNQRVISPNRFQSFRRPNPVFGEDYAAIRQVLIEARLEAGITQLELSKRLGKAPSHVSMVARGQRRVDILELFEMALCLDMEPASLFERVAAALVRRQEGRLTTATDVAPTNGCYESSGGAFADLLSSPTMATRSELVLPALPKGTPATTTI